MYKRSSFLSEHTIEYYLVPELAKILHSHSNKVIPIFYWSSREGNTISQEMNCEIDSRVLALFPRRPKLTLDPKIIECKINKSIIEFANEAMEYGIKTIAGIPIVSSLISLSSCKYLWFLMNKMLPKDYEFNIQLESGKIYNDSGLRVLDHDMLKTFYESSPKYKWREIISMIQKLKRFNNYHNYQGLFGNNYKPVYFLII